MSENVNLEEKKSTGYFVWISWLKDRVTDNMHHCESSSWRCYTAPQTCITQNGKGGQEGTGHHPNTVPPLARLPHVGNNFSKREQKTEEDTLQ